MEPLMSKNDNFSFGFYKGLVEKVKNKLDAMDEEAYNEVNILGFFTSSFANAVLMPFFSITYCILYD